jgi:hypothetical protein
VGPQLVQRLKVGGQGGTYSREDRAGQEGTGVKTSHQVGMCSTPLLRY